MRAPALTLTLVLLLVAGCDATAVEDSGLDGDPVVGTWQAVGTADEVLLTSRVDQSVPNFRARGEGGIVLSGALEDRLHYVSSLYRYSEAVDGVYAESITFASRPGFDLEDGPITLLLVDVSANPASASVNRATSRSETYFGAPFPAGTGPFSYRDGRLTVPGVEVVAEDGSGRRVAVGGTLTFPVVELRAGQE
ncbi:hypothetical protein, partial [Rubrivirga sp.]|uniref:hypothetical protein n=1 Tax=Rubrivirga sp. TaxID=1885344 RepID=UPI003C754965